jgi:hypothetical protein
MVAMAAPTPVAVVAVVHTQLLLVVMADLEL